MDQTLTIQAYAAPQVLNRDSFQTDEVRASTEGRSGEFSSRRLRAPDQECQRGGNRIRRILVPVDFSPASAKAIEGAMTISNQFNAVLSILHVVDINARIEAEDSESFMTRLWSESTSKLDHLARALGGQAEARTMIEQGLPWETIAQKSHDFDLVVLGKDNARKRRNLFSRHTAQRVIEYAACPVMVVPCRD